ncbi:MAG: hypothetical protein M3N43_00020 [Actinomycetota bacterium]|nr:hypothetical protein [Actinomycetota bacterium]
MLEQECYLLLADRASHEPDGRDPLAMEADGAEEALDHHQVPAVLHPMEVEQLEAFVEARGQLVLVLPFGKVLQGPDPATGIGDL